MNKLIKSKYYFVMTIIILVYLAGCSAKEKGHMIKVVGSTTVLPALTRAAEVYMKKHPNVTITINSGGSGVGVSSVANNLSDIGMISRNISSKERESFKNIDFKLHLIGRDAVACVVSSEIYSRGIKSLSADTIRKIYIGEIGNWKEIGGPDREITVVDKESHRGTRNVFMKYIFGDESARAPGADIVVGSNNEEQSKIGQSDGAIGMLSYAWINKDVIGLGIHSKGEIITPDKENISNGSYPIVRNLYLVTRGNPSGLSKEFINFILGPEGQEIVEESGYVPAQKV